MLFNSPPDRRIQRRKNALCERYGRETKSPSSMNPVEQVSNTKKWDKTLVPVKSCFPAGQERQEDKLPRRVRFDLTQNQKYDSPRVMSQHDIEKSWYTCQEYRYFRISCLQIVRRMESSSCEYGDLVRLLYDACLEIESSEDAMDKHGFASAKFAEIVSACEGIGLEHYVVEKLGTDRGLRRAEIKETVIEFYLEMMCLDKAGDEGTRAHLRERSESISRPSAVFARALAELRQTRLQVLA